MAPPIFNTSSSGAIASAAAVVVLCTNASAGAQPVGLDEMRSFLDQDGDSSASDTASGAFDLRKVLSPVATSTFGDAIVVAQQAAPVVKAQAEWLIELLAVETARTGKSLPPLDATITASGSMLLEWVFPGCRLGFGLEADASQSGWFYIAGRDIPTAESGTLARAIIPVLLSRLP
jgi:hypothetical protein